MDEIYLHSIEELIEAFSEGETVVIEFYSKQEFINFYHNYGYKWRHEDLSEIFSKRLYNAIIAHFDYEKYADGLAVRVSPSYHGYCTCEYFHDLSYKYFIRYRDIDKLSESIATEEEFNNFIFSK